MCIFLLETWRNFFFLKKKNIASSSFEDNDKIARNEIFVGVREIVCYLFL